MHPPYISLKGVAYISKVTGVFISGMYINMAVTCEVHILAHVCTSVGSVWQYRMKALLPLFAEVPASAFKS